MKENFKKYLVEFIGTFFLMLTVGSAVIFASDNLIAPIAIGLILMIMVYAGGSVSGGHYNPAVSLAAVFAGALDKRQLVQYWIAQFLGAFLATVFVSGMTLIIHEPFCPFTYAQIMLGEFLFTFALCYVVLQTAVSKKTAGNSFYGFAIGSTVTAGAFTVGGIICFGAFNPAVAVGLGFLHICPWIYLGVTVLVNLVSGIIAAYTYKLINSED